MKILGIETSCDETAICLIEVFEENQTIKILGNTVHSQIADHIPYGGVFPMLAKREHERNLPIVLKETLEKSGYSLSDIDFIAVTIGPGLEPALWTGILFARDLAKKYDLPIIPCNHMEGHILTGLIQKKSETEYKFIDQEIKYPAISLLISGGHTQIILIEKIGSYKIVGETRDDAIGECFDKVARTIGLEYPGGPKISKLADSARALGIESIEPLPRPMIANDDLDFSFSGLKTAVLYLTQKLKENGIKLDEKITKGIARETEDAVTEVVIAKMRKAIEKYAVQTIVVGGGVIANKNIRENIQKLADECFIKLFLPQLEHSTDNGLMIALAGFLNREKAISYETKLTAQGTLALGPRT